MSEAKRPSPYQLWQQANGDGDEYRRLLREHGHLVRVPPGQERKPSLCTHSLVDDEPDEDPVPDSVPLSEQERS